CALIAEGEGRADVPAASADDHLVGRAQVLVGAVVDRAHALGHRHVLLPAAGDARVALPVLLRLAVDLEVVLVGLVDVEASVPARGVWEVVADVPAARPLGRDRWARRADPRAHTPLERVEVVDRDVSQKARAALADDGRTRWHCEAGEEDVADAPVVAVGLGLAVHAVCGAVRHVVDAEPSGPVLALVPG